MKKTNPKNGIIIAFGELFLKSENVQRLLKRRLLSNIRFFLKKENINFRLLSFHERIFVETKEIEKSFEILKRIFGIAWLSKGFFFEKESFDKICQFVEENYPSWIKENETFALNIKRDKQAIKETKKEIIEKLANIIKRKVNLSSPEKEIFLEGRKQGWFLYFKKEKGAGGLPVGSQGKVLTLISGGIDSPVASYLLAKRGAENIWLHFHSFPLVSKASIEKIKELAQVFLNFQPHLKIYLFPFKDIQIEIKTKAPIKYRIVLYRRAMFKIAEKIARKEGCRALVTGESLGQVSSQTLTNLEVINEIVTLPVLRPLIGMDKEEIISIAKKIGTFEISIKPQEDCCLLFVPPHPTAQADLEKVKEIEKKLNLEEIIKNSFEAIEILAL